jgi:hypothetical protein
VAYGALRARGTHPAFHDLAARFPGVPSRLLARLARTCSALAWWCPVFGEAEHLPAMAFPFVKLFAADDVGAFEALASVFLNVAPGWFESFPNPPMHVIAVAEARALRSSACARARGGCSHDPRADAACVRSVRCAANRGAARCGVCVPRGRTPRVRLRCAQMSARAQKS